MWWKNFFSGLVIEMWGSVVSEEQTRAEADFIQKMFQVNTGLKILDVPCGNGRLSLELASQGYFITGVDISQGFLAKARSTAAERKLNITWKQQDMRDLPWREEFHGAFCFGNSFGYLDDEGNADFLKAIYATLKPGGKFILDAASVAEAVIPKIQDRTEMQIGDILFIEENHYDHVLSRLDTHYAFVKGGVEEKKFGSHRLYTYRELHHLLAEAGFKNLEAYGSLHQEPFKFGSQGLYFVARKDF